MGIWANSQEEAHRKMQELVEDAMPEGDTLVGASTRTSRARSPSSSTWSAPPTTT